MVRRAASFGVAALLATAACAGSGRTGPYDPTIDGLKQLQAAANANERVLVVVGGNW